MRCFPSSLVLGLALLLAAAPAHAQGWKGVLKKAKAILDSSGGDVAAVTATAGGGDGKVDPTAGPRNRAPQLTGVWVGSMLAPEATPNRYDYRIEVTEREGMLSGQVRIGVPGKPLQFVEHSIDGSVADGIITLSEVNDLRTGSNVPYCAVNRRQLTLVVRNDGSMVGAPSRTVHTCGDNVRLSLKQVSTANPELADGGAPVVPGAGGGTPPGGTGAVPAPPAGPAAEMVRNPNVTGTWTGILNAPRQNPNRYRYRLELTQKGAVVTGTARLEVPDQPLRYAVHSIEGSVDEGIVTLQDKELMRYGSERSWCTKRLVLMLKTDGTLSGDWGECDGGGQVHLAKPK